MRRVAARLQIPPHLPRVPASRLPLGCCFSALLFSQSSAPQEEDEPSRSARFQTRGRLLPLFLQTSSTSPQGSPEIT
ncbi:hypothetical protein GUJ93_ZPchr0003g18518 [Zizania palustris]|uniref:Uncharacterized protein n=1 Tax=Zizania palustris TaxID=103762 RepID=A0A8J5V7G2_ZIZPA|nr:hypothetical protein GUJ93_ZPchr0003g18518 [Zizania palustris]